MRRSNYTEGKCSCAGRVYHSALHPSSTPVIRHDSPPLPLPSPLETVSRRFPPKDALIFTPRCGRFFAALLRAKRYDHPRELLYSRSSRASTEPEGIPREKCRPSSGKYVYEAVVIINRGGRASNEINFVASIKFRSSRTIKNIV